MTRKILINTLEAGEVRVAAIVDGKLDDLFIERADERKYLGNIYTARVVNVEPSIQAAFMDFGGNRNGFLHASDVMPFYADQPEDLTAFEKRPRGRYPQIQELLVKGQEVLVQVSKDGIGSKGPTLTTYVSVPGKYMVLMPSLERVGVSKKIRDMELRRNLKKTIRSLEPPEGMGYIVRTEGARRTRDELKKDLDYLIQLWESIERRVKDSRTPASIYRESDLVIRTVRDLFTKDVDEVLIDSEEVYNRAVEFVRQIMPEEFLSRLKLYDDPIPLFHRYKVEEQIERIFQKRVRLESGGHLVIEQTEALVAIDVNSGKYRKEADLEDTAYQMNLEAIPEVCRQLRLRDLGGLIVIDMIDMRDLDRRRDVERKLLRLLRKDNARVRVAPISEFGLVELTRQRVRPSIRQAAYVNCKACGGSGHVKSIQSMVVKILRDVKAAARQGDVRTVEVTAPPDVAEHLLNRHRLDLVALEENYGSEIEIMSDPGFLPEEIRIETY